MIYLVNTAIFGTAFFEADTLEEAQKTADTLTDDNVEFGFDACDVRTLNAVPLPEVENISQILSSRFIKSKRLEKLLSTSEKEAVLK